MQYDTLPQSSWAILPRDSWQAFADSVTALVHPADAQAIGEDGEAPDIPAIREGLRFASLTPVAGRKLLVIFGADTWTPLVANTMLKLLEEPPAYLKIVIVGESPLLLPTVRSRVLPITWGDGVQTCGEATEGIQQVWAGVLQAAPRSKKEEVVQLKGLLERSVLLHGTLQREIVQEGFRQ